MSYKRIIPGYEEKTLMHMHALSDEQCEKIVCAAVKLIWEMGIEIHHQEVQDMLGTAGCTIDGSRVHIPESVVRKALSTVPPFVDIYDRFGERKMHIGGYQTYFGPGLTNTFFSDVNTGERRATVQTDTRDVCTVADALKQVDFVMGLSGITDCPPAIADVVEMNIILQNTSKPVSGWSNDLAGCKDMLDMFAAVAGGLDKFQEKPFAFMYAGTPVSPYTNTEELLDQFLFWVQNKVPTLYTSGAQSGINAPITMAGMLTSALVDNLTAIVLSQLTRPGAPILSTLICVPLDMLSMQACYGAPERCLALLAQADINHYLALPSWDIAGASDAKVLDEQASYESALTLAISQFSGTNVLHDLGFLEAGMMGSLEMMALSDEIISYIRRISKGVEVNDETMAADLIQELGPGGSFISEEHTVEHFHEELWMPSVSNRCRFATWRQDGAQHMGERLTKSVKQILASHKPTPLAEDVVAQLNAILKKAYTRVGK